LRGNIKNFVPFTYMSDGDAALRALVHTYDDPRQQGLFREIADCLFKLGRTMDRAQANRLERLRIVFVGQPRPTASGQEREHYTKEEIWMRVWQLLLQYPCLRASNIDGIVARLELLEGMVQAVA
jgi:hypothetical protein